MMCECDELAAIGFAYICQKLEDAGIDPMILVPESALKPLDYNLWFGKDGKERTFSYVSYSAMDD